MNNQQINNQISGMNLREAIALAKQLNCSVRTARRTGEYVITTADKSKRCRANLRRKDAPVILTQMLKRLFVNSEMNDPDIEDEEAEASTLDDMVAAAEEASEAATPATAATASPPVPPTVASAAVHSATSLSDRVAAFKAEREQLIAELKGKAEALEDDYEEIKTLLEDNRRQREEVTASLAAMGVAPIVAAQPSSYGGRSGQYIPTAERPAKQKELVDYLTNRKGTWISASEIAKVFDMFQPSLLLNPLVMERKVDMRGNKRSRMYRVN